MSTAFVPEPRRSRTEISTEGLNRAGPVLSVLGTPVLPLLVEPMLRYLKANPYGTPITNECADGTAQILELLD